MIQLSAFADEISPEPGEQLSVLGSENIHFLDLRGAWGTNVLDFTDQQIATIKQALADQHVGVAAIGSPIGKVAIDTPFSETLQSFERALEIAQSLQTSFIRIFSFYPPAQAAGWRASTTPISRPYSIPPTLSSASKRPIRTPTRHCVPGCAMFT